MPSPKGADRTVKPCPGKLCAAYDAWVGAARKGETFVAWVGEDINKIVLPPEQRMTRAQRAEYETQRKIARAAAKAKNIKVIYPSIPEPFKRVRPDIMALQERLDRDELRGLIELRVIVRGVLKHYECTMLVQRNGLAAVRAREAERFK